MRFLRPTAWLAGLAVVAAPAGAQAAADGVDIGDAKAPVVELDRAEVDRSLGVTFVRYRQEVGGVPVLGAEAVITDGPGRRADLLVDGTRRAVDRPGDARVGPAAAIRAGRRAAEVAALRGPARATLAIRPDSSGGRLVWQVLLPSQRPLGSFDVLVDARTGAVLRVRDLLRRLTGQGRVFDPNPITTQGSVDGLIDSSDANSAALTAQLQTVTLERLSGNCLVGDGVNATMHSDDDPVCDNDAPVRDWSGTNRLDDEFEAVMAYFHIDRTREYIRSTLGFTGVMSNAIHARADAVSSDNSFYDPDPAFRDVTFGTGGVDDAEDAEVINHEYGHAIQDDQVPGFGESAEGGAMGEGFGDYLAAAMSHDEVPSATFDPCFAEWDERGTRTDNVLRCLRRLDGDPTAQQVGAGTACDAEVHCAGEAWSSALWDLRTALGGTTTDTLVIQSHESLTPMATFEDGGRSLLAADQALNAGANDGVIRDRLEDGGLLGDDSPPGARATSLPAVRTGNVHSQDDPRDLYAVSLAAGADLVADVSGSGEIDLRVYRPGTADTEEPGAEVASSANPGASESLRHTASTAGTYLVAVSSASGAGSYTLNASADSDRDFALDQNDNCATTPNAGQANADGDAFGDECDSFPDDPLNDADRDGLSARADNCPDEANSDQANWDSDDVGDACDNSARVTLTRLRMRRGGRVLASGRMLPAGPLSARDWRVRVERRRCTFRRCRWRFAREVAGRQEPVSGSVRASMRLALGRYRARAVLRDSFYTAPRSRWIALRVRR